MGRSRSQYSRLHSTCHLRRRIESKKWWIMHPVGRYFLILFFSSDWNIFLMPSSFASRFRASSLGFPFPNWPEKLRDAEWSPRGHPLSASFGRLLSVLQHQRLPRALPLRRPVHDNPAIHFEEYWHCSGLHGLGVHIAHPQLRLQPLHHRRHRQHRPGRTRIHGPMECKLRCHLHDHHYHEHWLCCGSDR